MGVQCRAGGTTWNHRALLPWGRGGGDGARSSLCHVLQANSINGSLLVLGRVVNALIDGKQTHVPYRESKLTRLLQYPLSGMGKTSIVVTCSPSMYNRDETLAAVYFGQRCYPDPLLDDARRVVLSHR